ncbi:MAG TPA: sigma-70 family RNA polymerase sigma factor [Vicinamibacterales bacterium]|nr:sigma-70 family RNA polymerase sigma factor [Vicinamibacterales bacterium]
MKHQRLFTDNLELIQKLVQISGRRHHLSHVELEDFTGYVNLELLKDDCATLRKFQNRSSWWTFLATVIEKMALDFLIQRWGRWRPSAMAEKLGPVAVILDRLVNRDGHTVEEAMEIVRTNHDVGLTYAELRAMWERLPPRPRLTEVGEEAAAAVSSPDSSEVRVEDAALKAEIERLEKTLHAAFHGLAAQDRVMIALRYDHGLSVVEIAKAMNSSVPTIHRRLDRSLKELRATLARAGFDPREISSLIGHSTVTLSPLLQAEVERFLRPVRLSKRDG